MSARGWFVTATDTGVGKTLVTTGLVLALRAEGLRVRGMKPVAAGAERSAAGDWRNEDADALLELDPELAYEAVNPFLYREPAAPSTAAVLEGAAPPAVDDILAARDRLAAAAEAVVVEGAGGWHVPLGPDLDIAGLAAALGYPVVLVVGLRLGCINHALLTAAAIAASGCPLAGWVGNVVDPDYRHLAATRTAIAEGIGTAPFAELPWLAAPSPRLSAKFLRRMSAKLLSK